MANKENKELPVVQETTDFVNEQGVEIMNAPQLLKMVQDTDKHVDRIFREYDKAERAFLSIACELKYLYDDDRYKYATALNGQNDVSFDVFTETVFGFKKSQAYALVSLVERFGIKNANGTYKIDDKYKEYGQTQLINMEKLTDEQITEYIEPEMTVAEIKKLVKQISNTDKLLTTESSGNEEEQETEYYEEEEETSSSDGVDVVTTTAINSQAFMCFQNFDEFNANLETVKQEIAKIFKANPDYKVTINYEW